MTTVDRDTLRARARADAAERATVHCDRASLPENVDKECAWAGDPPYWCNAHAAWASAALNASYVDANPTTFDKVRRFETGACRDTDHNKIDPEGFLDPAVILAFCHYMQKNQTLADGSTRASDNWQKGIPLDAYMKSMWRHMLDLWLIHRGHTGPDTPDLDDVLGGVLFNTQGYWSEILKDDG